MTQEFAYLQSLVRELLSLPAETGWVEFKHNNTDAQQIGEYLSALSNSAALEGKAFAYLLWGIEDGTHAVVGTHFVPQTCKIGNEELESWLLRQLSPKIDFRFHVVEMETGRVVLLEIGRAFRHPVQFAGVEFIRVGSYKKKLKDFPEKERALWRIFDAVPFEVMPALEKASAEDVLRLLDYPAYFDLLGRPLPENREGILQALAADELIERHEGGGWCIRNLGAMLFAKRLADFSTLKRKAVRLMAYRGSGRVETIREQEGSRGYAAGFEGLIGFINGLLPSNEALASLMRRVGICEERGSGVDKVVSQTEFYQLPAPAFETTGEHTRATLFTPRALSKMDQVDRVRACYLHACLRYVQRDFMTNASLRERFGIEQQNSALASRLIKEALTVGVIRAHDEDASRKYMKYLPAWA